MLGQLCCERTEHRAAGCGHCTTSSNAAPRQSTPRTLVRSNRRRLLSPGASSNRRRASSHLLCRRRPAAPRPPLLRSVGRSSPAQNVQSTGQSSRGDSVAGASVLAGCPGASAARAPTSGSGSPSKHGEGCIVAAGQRQCRWRWKTGTASNQEAAHGAARRRASQDRTACGTSW